MTSWRSFSSLSIFIWRSFMSYPFFSSLAYCSSARNLSYLTSWPSVYWLSSINWCVILFSFFIYSHFYSNIVKYSCYRSFCSFCAFFRLPLRLLFSSTSISIWQFRSVVTCYISYSFFSKAYLSFLSSSSWNFEFVFLSSAPWIKFLLVRSIALLSLSNLSFIYFSRTPIPLLILNISELSCDIFV